MSFAVRVAWFAAMLLADAARLPAFPGGVRPLLFVALAACYGLRGDALTGGTWGFAGGLALGLLYDDGRVGPFALGGLLAGSVPAALKKGLFWQYGTGQALLGLLAGLLFGATPLALAGATGQLGVPAWSLLPRALVDAILTGAVCPILFRLTRRAPPAARALRERGGG